VDAVQHRPQQRALLRQDAEERGPVGWVAEGCRQAQRRLPGVLLLLLLLLIALRGAWLCRHALVLLPRRSEAWRGAQQWR
jgi:hypothetical protein